MRKQARSVLTGLLVFCCLIVGFVPVVHVQAVVSSSVGHNIVVIENADLAHMVYPLAVSAQTAAPVESPSSGPWQTAWAWIQKAVYSTGTWIAEATHSTGTWIAEATHSTGTWIAEAIHSTGTWIAEATHSTGAWIQKTTHSTGAFIASVSVS